MNIEGETHRAKLDSLGESEEGTEYWLYICPAFTPTDLFLGWSGSKVEAQHFVSTTTCTQLLLTAPHDNFARREDVWPAIQEYAGDLLAYLDDCRDW